MNKKILFMGRVAVGKSSIKLVIFEGHDPNMLLKQSLSPTRGIESNVYSWMDLEIGIFDISGQELNSLLEKEVIDISIFEDANIIIYILDYYNWENNFQNCIDDIRVISNIIQKYSLNTQLVLFFHKIDIFNKIERVPINKIKKKIINSLSLKLSPKIYFTSIEPDFMYFTYSAFFEILGTFSQEIADLKTILDTILKKYSKILCIITNLKNGSIIVQSMTDDFNTKIISDIYNNLSKKYLSSLEFNSIGVQLQNVESQIFISNIIKDDEEIYNLIIKNIITFSETLESKKLIKLMTTIREKVNKSYLK